jgi:minimal PKS acyl carrier protein
MFLRRKGMASQTIELADLRRILRDGSGTEAGVDLEGEILDTTFDDLGYDSLAIMETAARISREYGVLIDDSALSEATTPRLLLSLVNPV